MKENSILVRVVAPHFVAGLVFALDGTCIEAAPILSWAVGRSGRSLKRYFDHKGWVGKRVITRT